MEDNPEVHMDTDVSSTTADVPETQEVTGSDGQVEMVIVVEKVDEESEMELSSVVTDDLPRVDNEVEAFSVSSPDDKVSSNDVEPHCEAEKSSAVTEDTNPSSPIEDQIQESPKELVNVLKIKDDITTSSTSPNIDVENQNSKDQVDSSDKPKAEDISDHQNEILEKKQEISEKKSPIKQLGMEEVQTTIIEISEKSYDADGKKEEVATVSVDISEKSNDSHIDSISDVSDKDHNKSISRELKSLIKSAKESKIISECTQLTTKTRKSRVGLDNSSASPSFDADKILGRRNSNNSQLSNSSELSEKVPIKRSMRSQNPEFVIKVKQFLNSVTGKNNKGDSDDEGLEENKRDRFETMTPSPKKKKLLDNQEEHLNDEGKLRFDPYCWRCHWHVEQVNEKAHQPMYCTVCPRAYHYKCLSSAEKTKIDSEKSWVCPECLAILHAESSETRSPSMKKISLGLLRELLQYALERIMDLNGVEPFMSPVDRAEFPDYDKYVVHPMDLSLVKKNVEEGVYGSTEAFAADVQWILHNSIIFNTLQSKLTGGARALVRTCRAEMGEIEACAECYAAAHARRPTWFTDVCAAPHVLLWAKLKGFPYWPAKGMSVNSSGLVDVRFFGAHDRAWVPARDCFLYSEKDPNNFRTKRQDILDSMQEAEHHIRNISRRYGKFVYPPFRTQFDPAKLNEHIKAMIPLFDGDLKTDAKEKLSSSSPSALKNKGRSNSKSSKSSNNDGDVSETEDVQTVTSRKMADGAEIAREDDYVVEKDGAMEIDTPKNGDESKKRRRSNLEEAVITIMDNSSSSKKRRHDGVSKDKNEPMSKKSKIDNADKNKDISKTKKAESTPSKENKETPSSTVTNEVSAAVTPKSVKSKSHRSSISKEKVEKEENRKISKSKHAKMDKSGNVDTTPESKARSEKRTHSKNKSINNSHITKVEKKDKLDVTEKNDGKNKGVESDKSNIVKSKTDNREHGKNVAVRSSKKSSHLDDNVFVTKVTNDGLPTISSVRSLSTRVQTPNNVTDTKTLEITIEANPDSSIFTPTSTDNIRNMKEAVNKLQKLKNGTEQSLIGKVGVKAFARMKSPEKSKQNVEVEIKAEPIDFDDADRQVEKLDLMNVFRLRPVNPLPIQSQKLRDVRINKVVVTPVIRNAAPKQPESRKARKTFPQPKKPDEGRSELNGKNSMVYIPIQPPSSQAPVRPIRPITISANTQCVRPPVTSTASTIVNTVRPPMMPIMVTSSAATHPPPNLPPSMPASSVVTKSNLPLVPAVGQMPATVQTVPMITTVNGQCFFSLQPLMSVGGVENPPQPVLSELPERSAVLAPVAASSVPAPPAGQASATPPQVNGTAKDTIGEMPRLQQRPILSHLETSRVAPPSSGPVTDKLNQSAAKLTDFFRSLLEDVLESVDDPASSLVAAKLQLEQVQWKHQQEIQELKHNHDLTVSEMRASLEKEKVRAVSDALRTARADADAAVKAAKAKQWCANCSQEAQFYCCWNTSYCDFPCQRMHWKKHFSVCTQERNQDGGSSGDAGSPHKRLQPAPDSVPALQKSTAAPALTVGGKVAPARTCAKTTPEQAAKGNKSSIIVSMVDDKTGTPTVKCVGTYKAGAPQASPLIINNQILNNEESAKKVVTSGGYLIVGSGGSSPLVTPRRTHAIQYYT